MLKLTTADGRILTPPGELEPLLKGAYPAFFKLLGHIRFFYAVNELWDVKASLAFSAGGRELAAIKLEDGAFSVHVAGENFQVADEAQLDAVFTALQKSATPAQRRPEKQLAAHLDKYPCGGRCDMCLINIKHNRFGHAGSKVFNEMDRNCYYDDSQEHGDHSRARCPGCEAKRRKPEKSCDTHKCLKEKGLAHCLACGEWETCGKSGNGHTPGQCNLGITAEEVTGLIIPYCDKERLRLLRDAGL